MAKKTFAEKVQTKVTNKFADKVASGIVKATTTKPKKTSGSSAAKKSIGGSAAPPKTPQGTIPKNVPNARHFVSMRR